MEFEVFENQNPRLGPPRPPWFRWGSIVFWVIVVLLVLVSLAISLIADYVWMVNVGFDQVFSTIFLTKLLLGVIGFVLYGGVLFLVFQGIRRVYQKVFDFQEMPAFLKSNRVFFWLNAAVSVFFGLVGSSVTRGLGWETFLNFFNQVPFGVADPLFGRDVAFFVFTLPFLKFVTGLLIGLVVVILILQGMAYSIYRLYLRERAARVHLSVSVAALGILLAVLHLLSPYGTLLSNQVNSFQTSSVFGASFTDRVVNIPWAYVMVAVSLFATAVLLYALRGGRTRWVIAAPVIYVGALLLGQVASFFVQSFIVSPNEYVREKPYLQHNLDYTRLAYDLNDMTELEHPGNMTLSQEMLERNSATLENVRVNDARPLLDVYNQLQTFRTYYQFNDVDIDRYMIDGEYQQVFLGARELNTSDLPEQAQNWTNQKLRYTHGYGIAMSHVNQVTTQGQPEYMVKDLPPAGVIEVTRPQIYFGEENYDSVIVNTSVEEFDYPAGESNVGHRFEAETGIPMNRINRLLYAWEEFSPRIFISGQINSESRLLRERNVMDRLEAIAPFLSYDNDPYIVVRSDGSLIWIVDAYTQTGNYPYSEEVLNGVSYFKNPVKATVDAYTGEVNFYLVDPDEPIARTYQKIFPTLFTTDIPEDIQAHFRYPQTLFTYQTQMYQTYHMTDLEVFFSREDVWRFPTENYYDSNVVVEPYYVSMKLPGGNEQEFILIMPFTPNNRQNMIAWMAARSDGEHYGEQLVYNFPKQKTVYGPQQIENRINQNPQISQQLNLWAQGGSRVIRGNLLVIPIEDTLLYVEPIYIESNNETALPEVKQMVVAYGDYIVMERNFEESMARLMEMIEQGVPSPQTPEAEAQEPVLQTPENFIENLTQLFTRYQEALSSGDWAEAGRLMEELQSQFGAWEMQQNPGAQTPNAGAPSAPSVPGAPAEGVSPGGDGSAGADGNAGANPGVDGNVPVPGGETSPSDLGGNSPAEAGESASGGD